MLTINGVVVGNEIFPNNERIFKVIKFSSSFVMVLKYETDMDLFKLQMYKKYIDDQFAGIPVYLKMFYVPYSRMDREIDGYVFSLKYFAEIINDLNFSFVLVVDPHSEVTYDLFDRCVVDSNTMEVSTAIREERETFKEPVDYLFFPDAGAAKKYSKLFPSGNPYLCPWPVSFYGEKKRDLSTGKIVSYDVVDAPDLLHRNVLIVDDICSKGYTFYIAAKKLKELGASNVSLCVTHCEDSIYQGELLKRKNHDLINRIYTTNSLLGSWEHKKLIQVGDF